MFDCQRIFLFSLTTILLVSFLVHQDVSALQNDFDFSPLASIRLQGLHVCAATVLGAEWLVTASHCVEGQLQEWVSAYVGSVNLFSGGNAHKASKIIIHPSYNPLTMDCNVALIKVQEKMKLGSDVSALKISASPVIEGSDLQALVWGKDSNARETEVKVVQNKLCGNHYRQFGGLTPRMFCVTDCAEDSLCNSGGGGPLLTKQSLVVGFVSHGQGCKDVPTVAVKLVSFISWIQNNTGLTDISSIS